MISRSVGERIQQRIGDRKAIILRGARQVGKTTLLRQLLSQKRALWVNGDKITDRALWDNIDPERLRFMLEGYDYVVIDEAQRIANIGLSGRERGFV